jgi:hypothetical protein
VQPVARAIAGALAALVLLMFAVAQPTAALAASSAGAPPPQPLWLVKSSDLVDLGQQAASDNVTLPTFTWIGCGGPSDIDHCTPGQLPILTSYWPLQSLAEAGWRGTAIFDIEPWDLTPQGQRLHPDKFICLAAQLHRADPHMRVIITPLAKPAALMISEDVEAAACGAYAVDLQTQFANGSPDLFGSVVRTAVSAIRKVNGKILILAGLATNHPAVQTAANLVSDYYLALAAGVQGFWLNASDWRGRNKCRTTQGGVGCPQVGVQFLMDIGLATAIGAAGTGPTSPTPATTSPGPATTSPDTAATNPDTATTSPAPATTSPDTATTSPGAASTSPGYAIGSPAAGTQPPSASDGDSARLASDNALTNAGRGDGSRQMWQIAGAIGLIVATGLGASFLRRPSA